MPITHHNREYDHYVRDPEYREYQWYIDADNEPIACYTDPSGQLYRLVFRNYQNPVTASIAYFSKDDLRKLFEEVLPEFMIKIEGPEGPEYARDEDIEYTLTPHGRAIADGLALTRTEIKTIRYDDSSLAPVTEVTDIYE